jgi:hypothetical protein
MAHCFFLVRFYCLGVDNMQHCCNDTLPCGKRSIHLQIICIMQDTEYAKQHRKHYHILKPCHKCKSKHMHVRSCVQVAPVRSSHIDVPHLSTHGVTCGSTAHGPRPVLRNSFPQLFTKDQANLILGSGGIAGHPNHGNHGAGQAFRR